MESTVNKLDDNQLNHNKICIIACVNDDKYWDECLMYINRLIIPNGYSLDILAVREASSITSGYNEAMLASDAKYKIYMHQDVFITDIFLLKELIDIFNGDKSVGMLGVTGTSKFPEDGCMFNTSRVTTAYWKENCDFSGCKREDQPYEICDVALIDGLLMATQYDIRWREDILNKWDHYDSSQSIEYIKQGYKLQVPLFNKPVCIHNDGQRLNLRNYQEETLVMLEEYSKDILDIYNMDMSPFIDHIKMGKDAFSYLNTGNNISIHSKDFYDNVRTTFEEERILLDKLLEENTNESLDKAIAYAGSEKMLKLSETDADALYLVIAMKAAAFEYRNCNSYRYLEGKRVDIILDEISSMILYFRRIEANLEINIQYELIEYISRHHISFDIIYIILNLTEYVYGKATVINGLKYLLENCSGD